MLAFNNIFCLDKNVQDKLLEVDKMNQKKKSEMEEQKQKQQQQQSLTFKHAAIKYFVGKSLLVGEIKSLLKYTATQQDSPVCSEIQELP